MIIGGGLMMAPVSTCTWNPSDKSSNINLSNGNLTATGAAGSFSNARGTRAVSSGLFYFEMVIGTISNVNQLGIGNGSASLSTYIGNDVNGWGWNTNGNFFHNGSYASYSSLASSDVAQFALDMVNGNLRIGKNNAWQNSNNPVATGISGSIYPMLAIQTIGDTMTARFDPKSWSYAPPAGYFPLP